MRKFGIAVKSLCLSSSILLALVVMIFFCDLSILSSLPRQYNLISNATKQMRSIASAAVNMRNHSSSGSADANPMIVQTQSLQHSSPPSPLPPPPPVQAPTVTSSSSPSSSSQKASSPQKSTESTQHSIAPSPSTSPKEEVKNHTSINSNQTVTTSPSNFDRRIREFINQDSCKSHFFFTRLLPAPLFTKRDMMAVESLFKTNPSACLVILSDIMDSHEGQAILNPITNKGYKILTITPDFPVLLNNTPALYWYNELKSGNINPGKIPISQNLSNLLRYLALYKYGGVYIDTDFIVLKPFSDLRNTVGFESYNPKTGNFELINNAALIFDEAHPLVREFLEEFAATFDGDKWGNQGPHLVTRVIDRVEKENGGMWRIEGRNFTVLPPVAFYPVTWQDAGEIFRKPDSGGLDQMKRVDAQTAKINEHSYGLHLWNKLTKRMEIQEGSIISRLYSGHCIICRKFQDLN